MTCDHGMMLMSDHDDAYVDAMLLVNMQANTRSVTLPAPLDSDPPDLDIRFTFVNAGWSGSVHDMRVFNVSTITYNAVFPHPPQGTNLVISATGLCWLK